MPTESTLWVRAKAPFAAYRWLQAGAYRATSPVPPPSAVHGLLLNFAGIETRDLALPGDTTLRRPRVECLCLAIGQLRPAARGVLYQQLHGYRVGTDETSRRLAERARGSKYQITPVRREILIDLDVVFGVRGNVELLGRIEEGVRGRLDAPGRYGLPFAGDNNFLFDRIDVLSEAPPASWYERLSGRAQARDGSCRLTIDIDRRDSSRTIVALFAPSTTPTSLPGQAAWTWTPRTPGTPMDG